MRVVLLFLLLPILGIGQGDSNSMAQWVTQKEYNIAETPKSDLSNIGTDYAKYSKAASRGKTAGIFFVAAGVIMTAIASKNPGESYADDLYSLGIGSASLGLVAYLAGSGSQHKADKLLRTVLE